MAKFLATIERNDAALAFARDLVRRLHVGESYFEPRAFVRNFMAAGLLTVRGRMWLVELALAGESEARAILCDAILEYQSWHRDMPDELIEFNRKLVAGMVPSSGWPGPKKKDYFFRDICITGIVAAVVDRFALNPTGRSTRRRSACSIVGQALNMSPKAVEAIWRAYGRSMRGMRRGWAAEPPMGPLP